MAGAPATQPTQPTTQPTTATPTAGTHPAAASSDPATAERRLVTVLFTDLVGFTTLAEDRDPEAVRELLSRYFDTATRIIEVHGGTVEKFIGDAVMAVWGTPVAHEDDAERAVRAALELVTAVRTLNPDLQARAGVLTGEAAVTLGATNQGMVAGDLVNTAARLQGVAEPGTVLVGEATMRAAASAVSFESIGDHSLKGKTSPVPAWRAMRVVAQRGGHGRAEALEAPFVGRDEELRQLKQVLDAVSREQRVRLVSIIGPGGIGKSRLAWELLKYIDGLSEEIWWHRGRSPSYGEGITFWALGEMVRRRAGLSEDDDEAATRERIAATVAEFTEEAEERERIGQALLSLLGVEPAPDGGREVLFPAWRRFFELIAAQGPTVLVFEDLQWADSGLLDFIDHLLDWSRALPIVVITLARPELFDKRPGWGNRRHLTALALEPLPDDAVRALLDGLVPGLPDAAVSAIVARAEGIPLYAVETVRALLADGRIERVGDVYRPVGDLSTLSVPESLRLLIASRLDALQQADRALLQDAAVLGQVFSPDALGAMVGASPGELEPRLRDLVHRELLDLETDPRSPERGRYKFVQSLIREVAYGTLARRDRRSRHLAVARHFESIGDEELAGALASHYLAAHEASEPGPEADAVAAQARLALGAAAERATALGSHDQAVTYLDQALAITTEQGERAALYERASLSATRAGRTDAIKYAEAAAQAYTESGDEAGRVRAVGSLAYTLIEHGEIARAVEVLEGLVVDAERIGAADALAPHLANLSRAYMRSGRPEDAIAVADRALALAEHHGLELVVTEAFINKGSALNLLGRTREAFALMSAAVDRSARMGLQNLELRARNNLAAILGEDEPARASGISREALAIARSIGDKSMYNFLLTNVAFGVTEEGGDWDGVMSLLVDAVSKADVRSDRDRLRGALAVLELHRGEPPDALAAEIAELSDGASDPDELTGLHLLESTLQLLRGDAPAAYRAGMKAAELGISQPQVGYEAAGHAAIWALDAAKVRAIADAFDALPFAGGFTAAVREHFDAAALAFAGRGAEAVAGFRHSRAELLRLEQRATWARFTLDAIIALPSEPEVVGWADDARAVFESLGMAPFLARLDEALASAPAASSAPSHAGAAADPLRSTPA